MPILILSDIHANYVALQAVLDQAGTVEVLWCLGDTVGYGPQPNECVACMREQADVMLVGNHDLGVLGTISLATFNREARMANEWNGQQLDADKRDFLLSLEPMAQVNDTVTLAHASPRDPVWEYILSTEIAAESFEVLQTPLCFVGHTHQAAVYTEHAGKLSYMRPADGFVLELEPEKRYIINPGSVGQPRDGDARAAWALYDPEAATVTFRRSSYHIRRVQETMVAAGLPDMLAARLSFGL